MSRKSKAADAKKREAAAKKRAAAIAKSKADTENLRQDTAKSTRLRTAMKANKKMDLDNARAKGRAAGDKLRASRTKGRAAKPKTALQRTGAAPPLLAKRTSKTAPANSARMPKASVAKAPPRGVAKRQPMPIASTARKQRSGEAPKLLAKPAGNAAEVAAIQKKIAAHKRRTEQSGAGAAAQSRLRDLQKQLKAAQRG